MNIPDSDLPTIRRALRDAYNWSLNASRIEYDNETCLRAAKKYKAVLDRLKKPKCQHEFTRTFPNRDGEPAVTFIMAYCIKCGDPNPDA